MRCHYEVLGIELTADNSQIKKGYRVQVWILNFENQSFRKTVQNYFILQFTDWLYFSHLIHLIRVLQLVFNFVRHWSTIPIRTLTTWMRPPRSSSWSRMPTRSCPTPLRSLAMTWTGSPCSGLTGPPRSSPPESPTLLRSGAATSRSWPRLPPTRRWPKKR